MTAIGGGVDVEPACGDETAQFEEVMPVATIARQTRGLQTEYASDDPFADLSDERLEPGPSARAARRDPAVVVNNDDLAKPDGARVIREFVLRPLAREALLGLDQRRLPALA